MNQKIQSRKELLYLLSIAAELEHGICLQYLFAAFSLKSDLSEGGLTLAELATVRKWKATILQIASQEMLHLCQVVNISIALGGAPHLRRPNFPQGKAYYPTNLPWLLSPFSESTLRRLACYERPSGTEDDGFDCGIDAPMLEARTDLVPARLSDATIEDLYDMVRDALQNFDPQRGLLIGPPTAQISAASAAFPQLIQIVTRQDAINAIDLIVSQGEGSKTDRADSHFGAIKRILDEFLSLKAARRAFEPARPVVSNPVSHVHEDIQHGGYEFITDPFTAEVEDLGNAAYEVLISMLDAFFSAPDDEARRILSSAFLRIMTGVIVPLGEMLAKLPAGRDLPGLNAGMSFERYMGLVPFPHMSGAYVCISERLEESAERAKQLAADADAPPGFLDLAKTLHAIKKDFESQMAPPSTYER